MQRSLRHGLPIAFSESQVDARFWPLQGARVIFVRERNQDAFAFPADFISLESLAS